MTKNIFQIPGKFLFLFSVLTILGSGFAFQPAQAEGGAGLEYKMEVGIPDTQFDKGDDAEFTGDTSTIGNYIKAIYSYGIGIVGILAAVILMIGGVIWLTAGGNVNKVESAKQWIGGALTGLVLALTSYMLLYQINPELVQFRVRNIAVIDPTGMPEWKTGNNNCKWVISEQCPTASSYSQKASSPEECGEKPDPAGVAGPESYKTCCCIPTESSEDGSKEDCVSDGTVCNDEGGQSTTVADCSNCCNNWHYEGAQKICGLGSEGDDCEDDSNCADNMYCYDGQCYDGSEGDKCDLNDDQCTEGSCQDCWWPSPNQCNSCD